MNEQAAVICRCLFLLILLPLPASIVQAQTDERSASEIIKFLTYQSDRPGKESLFISSCGKSIGLGRENRQAARALVKFDASAIPDIENALESIEKRGRQSEFSVNAAWLFFAYARIMGPAAYPRLRRMTDHPSLSFLLYSLDDSIALSLGATSYVSGSRGVARIGRCRAEQPRDALDQFIIGWEGNEHQWLEASLGPAGKAALASILSGTTWAGMRNGFWHNKSVSSVAVGYRFDASGRFSQPEETLEEGTDDEIPESPNLEIDTTLINNAGQDCGTYRVNFKKGVREGSRSLTYWVDNTDLIGLLRLIAFCAAN